MIAKSPRPTILQVVPELDTGGAELTAVEISEAVMAAGGRALVASKGGRLEARLTDAGATFIRMDAASKNPITMLTNARKLKRLIADEKIDIVHARSRAPAWSAFWATRKTPAHFVTTYHGAYGQNNPAKGYYNSVMARGERVIANSNFTANLVAERHNTPPERLRTVYRGVETTDFDPAAINDSRVAELRKQWDVSENDRVILHAARLTSIKGQKEILAAVAHLQNNPAIENAVFVFAGDAQGRDTYRQTLLDTAKASGIAERVRFPGHCSDMPAAYAAADIALMPSIVPETFGRAAAEAQAMHCPVIVTRIGALQEVVLAPPLVDTAERTGWTVPVEDPNALAEAILDALTLDPTFRSALENRARQRVIDLFSLNAMKRQTLAVYDELLETRLQDAISG